MESQTKNKRGGCFLLILIIAIVAAFFTNPDKKDFDSYIDSQISMTDNRVFYNNQTYIYEIQKYRQNTTFESYFIFSLYQKEQRLYRSYRDKIVDRPAYVLKHEYLGMFGNFWNLEKQYQPF